MSGYEKRIYKCRVCGEFEVDTTKFSKCSCGANEIQVSYDSTFSYKNGIYNIERNIYPNNNSYFRDYKTIEKYAYPFYSMTKPQQKLYNKIKSFEKDDIFKNRLYYYENFKTMQDGTKQLKTFNISLEGYNYKIIKGVQYGDREINTITLYRNLNKNTNKSELTKQMLRFYKILYLIKTNELDIDSIKSRDLLKKLTEGYDKTQKEIYDYEFYC